MASQWPPKKNAAFTLYFSLYKSDGTIIANPGTYTKKVSIDGGAVADITASVTEEDTTYGQLSVVLAAGEMNGDAIWVYIKDDTAGCVPFTCTLYTAAVLHDDLATASALSTVSGKIDTVDDLLDTEVAAIKADTAAILADTGTDGVVVATGGITAASFAADALARLGIVAYGTAQAATGTTLQLASASTFANDELNGSVLVITGGSTGVGQSRVITDYVGSTDTATVDAWTTTPTGTITYVIFAAPPASATALPAVNVTHFGGSAGTFASGRPEVNTTHAAGTAWGSGAITAATLAADTITAAKVAADVTTEIQSGLATAAALSTVAGYLDTEVAAILAAVDTEVAAIKAKTDNLPAAPAATGDIPSASTIAAAVLSAAAADPIDANIEQINTVAIVGDGSGTPFDVA